MAEPKTPRDTSIPNEQSNKDPAEGSRENVESGISNRPIAEEQAERQNLPPRGESKDDAPGRDTSTTEREVPD